MRRGAFSIRWLVILCVGGFVAVSILLSLRRGSVPVLTPVTPIAAPGLIGSQSCRECHPKFFELWSTSFHGLAMQPFTAALAEKDLKTPPTEIRIDDTTYIAELTPEGGFVRERSPAGEKRYPIVHALGGKNIYYFLTPVEGGRLQVLPVAYDVRRKEWYDTAASAMRHFQAASDRPLHWRDPLFTFNTSCHGCHVSQLATNYDVKTDTYHTTWVEAGINCETCHGPCSEHVKAFQAAPKDKPPKDLKLISTRSFTPEQQNDSCSTCHAKAGSITSNFKPGDRFFDHFDLTCLEHADYYPDGRDLGENYTFTTWRLNPCAISGKLDCTHCHTSSGRNRFHGEKANNACLPCHAERVKNPTPHTHHKADSEGSKCVSCHMPMTEFARMLRSDHSLLPPTPVATLAFKSPNACNICHKDQDAAWADKHVREWHKDDYQAPILQRAGLIAAARAGNWSKLPDILAYITDVKRDEIFATSLIRLLGTCHEDRKWPALIAAMKDASPLVRSAATVALASCPDSAATPALLAATRDDYRLVRIRAAGSLSGHPVNALSEKDRTSLAAAVSELEASLKARPDDWSSLYNLGNHYTDLGRLEDAAQSYELSHRFRPDVVQPLVNGAIVYARLGRSAEAERALTRALAIEPGNAVGNLNLGLLRAEQGKLAEAEQHLRTALKTEPSMAQAAYNLAILLAKDRLPEAIDFCRKATTAHPADPRYAYTLAFYLNQANDRTQAIAVLQDLIKRHPGYISAYGLLGESYEAAGQVDQAMQLYRQALARPELRPEDRQFFMNRAATIMSRLR